MSISIVHSAKPFPVRSGEVMGVRVEAGHVPRWFADIVHNLLCKVRETLKIEDLPATLEDAERAGGIEPIVMLDLLAGGVGDGKTAAAVLTRRGSSLSFELAYSPARVRTTPDLDFGSARTLDYPGEPAHATFAIPTSGRPFPIQGARVTDGTSVPPGFVPEWLAGIALDQLLKAARSHGERGPSPKLPDIERAGGFKPEALLDLLAGGTGSGHAYQAVAFRQAPADTFLGQVIEATKK